MADRQHLGMGRRIFQLLHPIAEAGKDRPAGASTSAGAERAHLAPRRPPPGQGQIIHQADFSAIAY